MAKVPGSIPPSGNIMNYEMAADKDRFKTNYLRKYLCRNC